MDMSRNGRLVAYPGGLDIGEGGWSTQTIWPISPKRSQFERPLGVSTQALDPQDGLNTLLDLLSESSLPIDSTLEAATTPHAAHSLRK